MTYENHTEHSVARREFLKSMSAATLAALAASEPRLLSADDKQPEQKSGGEKTERR